MTTETVAARETASSEHLTRVFAALADPTRRAILGRLAAGEATVNELVAPFALSQPTISQHLKVLESAGLVSRGREAQFRPVRLNAKPLAAAARWIGGYQQFWDASFDRLDALATELSRETTRKPRKETRQHARKRTHR